MMARAAAGVGRLAALARHAGSAAQAPVVAVVPLAVARGGQGHRHRHRRSLATGAASGFLLPVAVTAVAACEAEGETEGKGRLFQGTETPSQPLPQPLMRKVIPKIENAREVYFRRRDGSAPDEVWLWGETTASLDRTFDALLGNIAEILSDASPASGARDQLKAMKQDIASRESNIAEHKMSRLQAPDGKAAWWARAVHGDHTQAGYDARIAAEREQIKQIEAAMVGVREEFVAQARQLGIVLDEETTRALLETVTGDDLLKCAVVFDHVKRLVMQFEKLLDDSDEQIETAVRYYAMYLVLLRALDKVYEGFTIQVEEVYKPQLKDICDRAEAVVADAQQKLSKGNASVLKGNMESARLTLKCAKAYSAHLDRQASVIGSMRVKLYSDIVTAENTLQTVALSQDMLQLLRQGRGTFDQIASLTMPGLRVFQNEDERREFKALTALMTHDKRKAAMAS